VNLRRAKVRKVEVIASFFASPFASPSHLLWLREAKCGAAALQDCTSRALQSTICVKMRNTMRDIA